MRHDKSAYSKYKTYSEFIENYTYLKFSFAGFQSEEHIPRLSLLRPLAPAIIRIYLFLERNVSYALVRPMLVTYARKSGDMRFITHYREAGGDSAVGFILYCWLRLIYFRELRYISKCLIKYKPADIPEKVNLYLLRWGYLLKVEPEFLDLIQGIPAHEATDVLDGLV